LQLACRPQIAVQVSHLHTTKTCSALPPLLFTLAKPLARITAAVAGKAARAWWRRLPSDRKAQLRQGARKHQGKFGLLCGVGLVGVYQGYASHVLECPVTGRKRFVALTPDQEKKISRVAFEETLHDMGPSILPASHPFYKRVASVSNRLLMANRDIRQIYDKQWTVTVVDEPIRNAFVLPSGNIFVFSGMLDLCKNDDQLAVVLGHEMAHSVIGHTAEKLTRTSVIQSALLLPMALLWAALPNDGVAFVADWFFQKVVTYVFELPFSRAQETEADEVGLLFAAKACFDVREAPAFWGVMQLIAEAEDEGLEDLDLEAVEILAFASTHPAHPTRQANLTDQLTGALSVRLDCGCDRLDCNKDPNVKLQQFKDYLRVTKKKIAP